LCLSVPISGDKFDPAVGASIGDSVLISSLRDDDLLSLASGAFDNELNVVISCDSIAPSAHNRSSGCFTVGVFDSLEFIRGGGDSNGGDWGF